MATALRLGPAMVRFTGRPEGHLGTGASDATRRSVVDLPWVVVRQVHGSRVVDETSAGEPADGLVTTKPGVALAVFTADCAPVALASDNGVIGVAHAGSVEPDHFDEETITATVNNLPPTAAAGGPNGGYQGVAGQARAE